MNKIRQKLSARENSLPLLILVLPRHDLAQHPRHSLSNALLALALGFHGLLLRHDALKHPVDNLAPGLFHIFSLKRGAFDVVVGRNGFGKALGLCDRCELARMLEGEREGSSWRDS
jgi:hypothetical protein